MSKSAKQSENAIKSGKLDICKAFRCRNTKLANYKLALRKRA